MDSVPQELPTASALVTVDLADVAQVSGEVRVPAKYAAALLRLLVHLGAISAVVVAPRLTIAQFQHVGVQDWVIVTMVTIQVVATVVIVWLHSWFRAKN